MNTHELVNLDKANGGSWTLDLRLQGECSSQAELHWHDVCLIIGF